jgi:hypothetical protein
MNLARLLTYALLSCSAAMAIGAPAPSKAPRQDADSMENQSRQIESQLEHGFQTVAFDVEDGRAIVRVPSVIPEDIDDIVWAGESIGERVLADAKGVDGGLEFALPVDLRVEPAGVLEIRLHNGVVLVRGIPDDSVLLSRAAQGDLTKVTCANPQLYSTMSCGGTTSAYSVPYKCCDNNNDGDTGGSEDGNSVWLAWVRAREYGWSVPSTWGNAANWCNMAGRAPGWTVSSTAAVNTIACNKSLGQVAWVIAVDDIGRKFTATQQSCKVEPSCIGSGTQNSILPFSTQWRFIRCSDTSKCGAGAGTSSTEVVVPGISRGTPTGAILAQGSRLTVTATGTVTTLGPASSATPAGNAYPCNAGCLLPSAHFGALIGRIGTRGPWFYVGKSLVTAARTAGQLYLAVNDTISDNNTGQFIAEIHWH